MVKITEKISVVIPTHNRSDGLLKSLESLKKQKIMPKQVIVIDDGSRVAIKENIFDSFPKEVNCILIRNDEAKGANNARNKGILAASSEYIAFLDDDDQFDSQKIEILLETIKKNPCVDVLYHPALIHMVNENVSYITRPKEFSANDSIFNNLLIQNYIGGTPMVTVRKKSLEEVGLFDEIMPALQDYELWLRLAKNQCKFKLINLPLTNCFYTTRTDSVSKSIKTNKTAISIINNKYSAYYSCLTRKQIRKHKAWKKKMIVHKSLLNGDIKSAMSNQMKLITISPTVRNIISIFVFLFGARFTFKLRAKMQ